ILDLMIHDLDLVLELVGADVSDVRATGIPILTPHVDIANARIEFANGAIANVTASRVSRERTRKLRIFQPTGYFSLDLAQASAGGHACAVRRAPCIDGAGGRRSGDAHAAALGTAWGRRLPAAAFEAFGGPSLEAAGATVLDRMERMSVVGFVEALWKLPAHFRLLARVREAFRTKRYDLAILVRSEEHTSELQSRVDIV